MYWLPVPNVHASHSQCVIKSKIVEIVRIIAKIKVCTLRETRKTHTHHTLCGVCVFYVSLAKFKRTLL